MVLVWGLSFRLRLCEFSHNAIYIYIADKICSNFETLVHAAPFREGLGYRAEPR